MHASVNLGRAVDYACVAERLGELAAQFDLAAVAFDPYRIKYLERELQELGLEIPLVAHGQGYYRSTESMLWMPHSIELLEADVLKGLFQFAHNPCLTWNSASAILEADNKGNRIFNKRKSTGRIDGLVALAMARGATEAEVKRSVYEDRGFLAL